MLPLSCSRQCNMGFFRTYARHFFLIALSLAGLLFAQPVEAKSGYCVFAYYPKNGGGQQTEKIYLEFGQNVGGNYVISQSSCNPKIKDLLFPANIVDTVMFQNKPFSFTVQECDPGKPPTNCVSAGGYSVGTENGSYTVDCEKLSDKICPLDGKCVILEGKCRTYTNLTSEEKQKVQTDSANAYLKDQYKKPEGYLSNILPDCAFSGTCDNINDLLVLLVNAAKFLFTIIGTVAFVMFVYGGFTMVMSMGNSDKVKQGREALVAAVVGLIVAFSAYILIDFVLDAIQASNEFRAIGIYNEPK